MAYVEVEAYSMNPQAVDFHPRPDYGCRLLAFLDQPMPGQSPFGLIHTVLGLPLMAKIIKNLIQP